MRPCEKCGRNNWKYKFNDEIREVIATCKQCQNVISWKLKPKIYKRKNGELWCEHKYKNGKRFLRTNDNLEWKKVKLKKGFNKGKQYLQIIFVK